MVIKIKPSKLYFWDTGALFLFFADHTEAKTLMKEVEKDKAVGYIPQLVLVEFYYKTMEKLGRQLAEYQLMVLKESKNKIIAIKDSQIIDIGTFKLKNRSMSIVDCVIAATAKQCKAIIITTDGDFDSIKGVKSVKLSY